MKRLGFSTSALCAMFLAMSLGVANAAIVRGLGERAAVTAPKQVLARASMRGQYQGALPLGTTLNVYIHLAGAHDDQLDNFVAAVSAPGSAMSGRFLTPQQYGAYFGATPQNYTRAILALRAAGFVIDELPANHTDIIAHASAARVAAFVGSPIDLRSERGRLYYTVRYQPVYPAGLGIVAMSGLDNYAHFHPLGLHRRPNILIGGNFSWSPQDLAVGYDLNPLYSAGIDGKGITIANATSGGGATASDLLKFEQKFKLPSVKLVTVGEPSKDPVSSDSTGESTLDLDSATSVARNVTFEQVVAKDPNSDSDFDDTYSYIVNKLGSTVHVVTTSWGDCEYDMEGTSSLTIDENLFKQAIAEGQYWFSASGDNGTDDCEDGDPGKGVLSVDFPGSSPYVMSVGGTNVKAKISNYNVTAWDGESTWQYSNSNGASGGGRSILYAKPSYQAKLTPADGTRDVPDVAALADDVNDGLWIYESSGGGLQSGWGGTSDAAPQWSGVFALIEQRYHNGKIVDPHVRLYQLAATSKYHSLFHDITSGENGVPSGVGDQYAPFKGYKAAAGFDLTTGLGSYIGYPLVEAY